MYLFSALTEGQRIAFVAAADTLSFDSPLIAAGQVRIAQVGADLRVTAAGKTIWLDGVPIGALGNSSFAFANGGLLVVGDRTDNLWRDWYGQSHDAFGQSGTSVQVWGLGGSDLVRTGSGADWLVGNGPIGPLEHISRKDAVGGNGTSALPSLSADGRYVVFDSVSTNLAPSPSDIHLKDLETGSISILSGTAFGDRPVVSADGLWVVFSSGGTLVPSPEPPVVIRSTPANPVQVTLAVSTTSTGVFADRRSTNPDVSADGRYVAFTSEATNLAPGGNTFRDVFLKDMQTGILVRMSTSLAGTDGNGNSDNARISADGRYVVFESDSNNLVAGDTNIYSDIFLFDRVGGNLISITAAFNTIPNAPANRPDIAHDAAAGIGPVVIFETDRTLVPADNQGHTDIYAWSMSSGTFRLVSASANGTPGNGPSQEAAISGDGRFVVFRSDANNLVPGDTNNTSDIFVKDLVDGRIAMVSVPATGLANGDSSAPAISLGGDWIAFQSRATNLAATDANGIDLDVFRVYNPLLRDTLEGGAGDDTYVIERYADIVVENANGGSDTVVTPLSYTLGSHLENLWLTGTDAIDGIGNALPNLIRGNATANLLSGLGGNDTLEGGAGNDTLDGGTGIDVAYYDIPRAQAIIGAQSVQAPLPATVSAYTLGSDTLINIERLAFSDGLNIALDVLPHGDIDNPVTKGEGGNAGKAYRLYQAAFDRTPDLLGLGYWIHQVDAGASLFNLATGFLGSAEFQALYGVNPSNEEYTQALYLNVLKREPDAFGYAYWNAVLSGQPMPVNPDFGQLSGVFVGQTTRQQMLVDFSESLENKTNLAGIIGNGFDYLPWPP